MTSASFAIVPNAVFSDSRLSLAEIRVLGALFSFRSSASDWLVWPSRQAIANRVGLNHLDSISRITRRLVDKGYVQIQRRQTSSLYRLLLPGSSPDPTPDGQIRSDTPPSDEEIKDQTKQDPLTPAGGEMDKDQEDQDAITVAQEDQDAITVAQAIVTRVNTLTRANLPTHPRSNTVRRVIKSLRLFDQEDITRAIDRKAKEFRFPAALLKPSILEAVIAESKRHDAIQAARIERERATLAALKPAKPANPETAKSALDHLRRLLR